MKKEEEIKKRWAKKKARERERERERERFVKIDRGKNIKSNEKS